MRAVSLNGRVVESEGAHDESFGRNALELDLDSHLINLTCIFMHVKSLQQLMYS